MSPKKSGKMTGGTVGKRNLIDPSSPVNKGGAMTPQGPKPFNPNAMPAIGYGSSQGPRVIMNKQKVMPSPPGGIMGSNTITTPQGPRLFDPTQEVNSAMSSFPSQGPKLFNPKVGINLGGAMTPNAMSAIGYGSSQGPTTFDPTQELNRTIGRGAGAFGMPGRSLVPSNDLKSRSRSL